LKAPALVAVDEEPRAFLALFAAAKERGVRVGWLELARDVEVPEPLAGALVAGAFKVVAAAGGSSVAVKSMRGAPVLRDLLREHFLGCALVLVRGRDGRPRLAAEAEAGTYRLELAPERTLRLDAAALVAELLRPRHRA
jgi:hypothetical protein